MIKPILFVGAALLSAGAIAKQPSAPLEPSGKWTVNAEEDLCLLSRSFGTGDSEVIVGFQPVFGGGSMDIILVSRDKSKDQRIGEARVRFTPANKTLRASYFSVPTKIVGQRLARITLSSEAFDLLQSSSEMRVETGPTSTTIHVPRTEKAVAAFHACEDDLLRSWNVDPETVKPGRAAKSLNPGRFFGSDSYPAEAVNKNWVGRVVVVVQVDATGRPTACRTVVGSAAPLNEATCRGAMKATYSAGKNAAGDDAPSVAVLAVRWNY